MIGVTNIALVERVDVGRDRPKTWINPRAYILFLDWDGASPLDAAPDAELVADLCGGAAGEPIKLSVEFVSPLSKRTTITFPTRAWPDRRTMLIAVDLRQYMLHFDREGVYRLRLKVNDNDVANIQVPVFGLESDERASGR